MGDAGSTDFEAAKLRGVKIVQYHGWNDAAIPPRSSVVYYEDVRKTMGDTSDFYRMYMVPGMLHCGGGLGPSTVDWVALLDTWVNAKKAPGDVTAVTGPGQAPGGPPSQLLCPYPGVGHKAGDDLLKLVEDARLVRGTRLYQMDIRTNARAERSFQFEPFGRRHQGLCGQLLWDRLRHESG